MAEHTPGPWAIEAHPERGGWYIRHYADEVAYVPPSATTDARLIAAAPDLLAALEEIAAFESLDEDEVERAHAYQAMSIARAAIAKARGTETTDPNLRPGGVWHSWERVAKRATGTETADDS